MMTRGKWIKHEEGYWRAVLPDGRKTEWMCFLFHPTAIIRPDLMKVAKIEHSPDYECSECGSRGWGVGINFFVENMRFCPCCGTKMEEG